MRQVLLFLSFMTLTCAVKAQQNNTKVPIQRISYVRGLPATIREQMPEGAKSCFFGSLKISHQKHELLVHLFNPNPKQTASGYFGTYRLMLHIFSKRRGQKVALINSIPVNYRSIINRPRKFGAQLLWLDLKQRRKPILKFDCFDPDGIYGAIGDNVLVVFSDGLKSKAVVQSLAFGAWHASDASGQSTTFNVDKRGLLELHTTLHPAGEGTGAKWTLQWDGKKFYPVNGPIKGEGIEPGLPYP